MDESVSKYAPKTKKYGMKISLTNSVMIAVGISNLTVEKYLGLVYSSLDLTIATETSSSLKSQDTSRVYKSIVKGERI